MSNKIVIVEDKGIPLEKLFEVFKITKASPTQGKIEEICMQGLLHTIQSENQEKLYAWGHLKNRGFSANIELYRIEDSTTKSFFRRNLKTYNSEMTLNFWNSNEVRLFIHSSNVMSQCEEGIQELKKSLDNYIELNLYFDY